MAIVGGGLAAHACGPDFPNTLLDSGDAAVLAAPTADFGLELQRLKLAPPEFHAVITTNTYSDDTINAESDDLAEALHAAGLKDLDAARIVARHTVARNQLHAFVEYLEAVRSAAYNATNYPNIPASAVALTVVNPPPPAEGLPVEFARYFAGSVAWDQGQTNDARAAWEAVLNLPVKERHYRSTWAAYMLGRSWADFDPELAVGYYQRVRQLAKADFVDSLGLAAASLGWEAQVRLQQNRYEEATDLYLAQLATGGKVGRHGYPGAKGYESAVISLQEVAAKMMLLPESVLPSLAANPQTRRVITAYIISHPRYLQYSYTSDGDHDFDETGPVRPAGELVRRWAGAVATAQVKDLECAEELALAAYQAGDWNLAQRWINHAPNTPTAEWLQVKLLLRAGETKKAGELLDQVVRRFPLAPPGTSQSEPTDLKDTLSMEGHTYRDDSVDSASQVLGELGAFHLARSDYNEALDALLRSGFWLDAAYVAERVMTVDELKNYVDFNWPAPDPAAAPPVDTKSGVSGWWNADQFLPGRELRYLLARRLARVQRTDEARAYYPPEWLAPFDQLQTSLKQGAVADRPAMERARAWFAAAWLMRTNGIELIGTEGEPDWHVYAGRFEENLTLNQRTSQVASNRLHASDEELERANTHTVQPAVRFHYRDLAALRALAAAQLATNDFSFQTEIMTTARGWLQSTNISDEFFHEAAALGLHAAKGMPDNSAETARVLCTAGWWIADYEPTIADPLYKALVRRCRHTDIGELADRKRWFPKLDENGSPLPWIPNPPSEWVPPGQATAADDDTTHVAAPTPPPTNYVYVLHRGNSLQDVVATVHKDHDLEISVDDLLAANEGLNPDKLRVGQKVFVPLP